MKRPALIFSFSLYVMAIAASTSLATQGTPSARPAFRWLDENTDRMMIDRINAEFAEQLRPPPRPEEGSSNEARFTLYARIGVYDRAALVLICKYYEESMEAPDSVVAYNFDLRTGSKSRIQNGEALWSWTFVTFAQFEATPVPDILFTFNDCDACEPVTLLGSFKFVSSVNGWEIREWKPNPRGIPLHAVPDPEGDEGRFFDCVYKIGQFDGWSMVELGVACLEESYNVNDDREVHSKSETLTVYRIENGDPVVRHITDKEKRNKLLAEVCAGSSSREVCRP